ncbi:MAG: VanZ family protein [Phycisphaerae bacterium]
MSSSPERRRALGALIDRLPPMLTTWDRRWEHWYLRTFPIYLVTLFSATHLPNLRLDGNFAPNDRMMHLLAFGMLAFLFWRFFEAIKRPPTASFVYFAAIVLIAYASFDEYTQKFVNRGVDWGDWLCNVAGIAIALTALETIRRMRHSAQPS